MFILKLGAEALSMKSEYLGIKCKEGPRINSCNSPLTSSTVPDLNGGLLENLLNGFVVESALLPDDPDSKRCKSATNVPKSMFSQSLAEQLPRPRSDTAPQSSLLSQNKDRSSSHQIKKRKLHSTVDLNQTKSILFESLSKQNKPNNKTLLPVSNDNDYNLIGPGEFRHNVARPSISELHSSYSTLSIDESKRLQAQINLLLKKIMHIIKSYSNYSSISESNKFIFVSHVWFRIIVLAIIQLDAESCRFMFRWLLLSIFNEKDEVGCSRRDKILLLEKLQEFTKSYSWLNSNAEMLQCVLFWFFSKFGYPDVFPMSQQTVMCKLNGMIPDKDQLNSILRLINELSEITENHVRQLLCQHLPCTTSMAEFLIQWT